LFSSQTKINEFPRTEKVFWPPYVPPATPSSIPVQEEKYPYEKQEYLLTPTELKFYRVLKPICDERNLVIFAKVRLEDLVTVPQYVFNNWKWRGYIRSRHIDFVLCDVSNLKIRCGIELDDWHHKFWKNHEIDERKDKILRDAGLPLIRIDANSIYDFRMLIQKIESKILN
jgi:very-short-patch-repair endonuclease